MKKKINILIIVSLVAIIALSAIQYYLISNTFELQKELFKKEAKKQLSFIETDIRDDVWDDTFLKKIIEIFRKNQQPSITKEKIFTEFVQFRDSLNKAFNEHFDKEITKRDLQFPVAYRQEVKSVILIDGIQNDTLLSANEKPILLFGKELNNETRWAFNSGRWQSSSQAQQNKDSIVIAEENIDLEIRTNSYVDVPNWKTLVLKRMWWILALAILSIATVIGLFMYALRSLIKQKKNTDIKTDFINNITHELKTPLATLSIATKTLQQAESQDDKNLLRTTIDTVDRQRTRLQGLIDQVLNNSQGYQAITLNKETVVDRLWLQPLVDDYKLTKDDVSVKTNFPVKEISLAIDKFHLSTAVLNVLDNAVKYGGNDIKIVTSVDNNFYKIAIADNGIGIDKKHHEKVFDKFYRVANTDVHNIKGLGLGLYYVNQIAKAHGGGIELDSKPNEGTTITIKIPVV